LVIRVFPRVANRVDIYVIFLISVGLMVMAMKERHNIVINYREF
jgi:hypothetical protein